MAVANFGYNGSMKLSKGFRTWFARRGALAIFIMLLVLLGIFQMWREWPQPRISHVLGSSTQQVDILWLKQGDMSNVVAANSEGMVFMMPLGEDRLMEVDAKNGNIVWEVELPFERSGPAGMLANKNTIFTINSTRADAYETTTGELKWSPELGDGHVSVIPQFDSNVLRIYYGEKNN
jgi:outer membrane protein assembly factor BamB